MAGKYFCQEEEHGESWRRPTKAEQSTSHEENLATLGETSRKNLDMTSSMSWADLQAYLTKPLLMLAAIPLNNFNVEKEMQLNQNAHKYSNHVYNIAIRTV